MKRLTEVDTMDLDSLLWWLKEGEGCEKVGRGLVRRWIKTLKKTILDSQLVIAPEMLNKGLPPIRYKGKSVNVVLGLWSRKIYDRTNQYIPRWCVSNTVYYCKHKDEFEGWIDLKDMSTRPLTKAEKRKVKK